MKTLLFLSFLTLVAGLASSMSVYGIVETYSHYGICCERNRERGQVNWWSVCTIVSAVLLTPVCIRYGEGGPWNCVCFIVPVSLMIIGGTPDYEMDPAACILHKAAGYAIGAAAVVLAAFAFGNWVDLALAIVTMAIIGLATRTVRDCCPLWLELAACAYVYWSLSGLI